VAHYSIKDIEHLTGIKAHTIRIWEKRYNIISPHRTDTNIRFYDDEDLKKILNISVLNKNGYKISKIARLSNERLNREILDLTYSTETSHNEIENMIIAMIDFDELKFEKIYNKSIMQMGFEDTMLKVVYPFFEKIGVLWQTSNINPTQEHFISNLVRQKINVAIDSLAPNISTNSKKFVLFLPEGEWHELGLLFYSFLIKKLGHKVFYLGSSVSLENTLDLDRSVNFDCLLTTVKTTKVADEFNNDILLVAKKYSNKKIYLLGNGIKSMFNNLSMPDNIVFPENPDHFKKLLSDL
jgi:DNA-binding transcriptional MerR regulator